MQHTPVAFSLGDGDGDGSPSGDGGTREVTTTSKRQRGDDDGHAMSDNLNVMHDDDGPLASMTTRPSTRS